jgi:glycosyltransferase involved in cell wall biosynthesis
VLLSIFGLAILVQLFYYIFVYGKIITINKENKTPKATSNEPVSIVICARNEAENLEKNLPLILEQLYPDFEVVVVNDCSSDETEDVLNRLKQLYSNLRSTIIKQDAKFTHSKKLALTVGIKAAKNEWILFTDADCFPETLQWLSGMASHFTPNKDVVLGYGGFEKTKGFINRLIRFDGMMIGLQYFTLAKIGKPYMGVGRNLAYRKSVFFKNRGFASHFHLDSGDDDLFVKEIATKSNTDLECSEDCITRTPAKKTFKSWKYQKARHLTTSPYYTSNTKALLALEPISKMLMYFSFIGLLFFPLYLIATGIALVVREIVFYVMVYYSAKTFKEKGLLGYALIFDFILPFLILLFYLSNAFGPKKRWK